MHIPSLTRPKAKGNGVVVDIGGSGTRVAQVLDGVINEVRSPNVSSIDELAEAISETSGRIEGVGVSVTGRVDVDSGVVKFSRDAAWVEGPLRARLTEALRTRVSLIENGDAHALAMSLIPGVEYGGIAVSLGNTLSFGAVDRHGALIRPCSEFGWNLGHWRVVDRETNTEAWWALGGNGLYDLERQYGDRAAERFGQRVGGFLVDAILLFQPNTVLLGGGIVTSIESALHTPVNEAMQTLPVSIDPPRVVYSPSRHTALFGAAALAGLR